ncbi:MAG TPA: GDSL-type esterase/lipase family protein [Armatimonadota bacterium]|jgi:lysophospholipase L1-like esterase
MSRFSKQLTWLLMLVFALTALAVQAEPVLKAGDRVVIYGDSITQQCMYSRYVQQYITCRYPDLKVSFYNAGWGGDTAGGALNRLDRDVLSLNPTVVTMFFGMNDGGYIALNPNILAGYRKNMESLILALQAKNVRPVVYTPGCVDPDRNPKLKDAQYNKTLEALGQADLELAKQYNCPSMDVHHPMLDFQNAQKAANPAYTMIGDAVHPNADGHLVMTFQMLKGLGAEPMPALGTFDAATGKADGLRVVSPDPAKIVLETLASLPVPFWFDASNYSAMKASGFLEMAGQKLTVKGLTAEAYDVVIDGVPAGRYVVEDLAAGVPIAGTYSLRAKLIHDAIQRKESLYFSAWRDMQFGFATLPDIKKTVDNLILANDSLQASIIAGATPAKATITLTPAPGGVNLALGKTYVSSDPNTHGWGAVGLTDGSYVVDAQRAYASNETPKFPKTVTIDLTKSSRIATVLVALPNIGSTKTVIVSVSADGTNFTDVGTHEFKLRTEEKYSYTFPAVDARYVRLTYPDHYAETVSYDPNFVFTSEVEVYAPSKNAK